MGNSSKNMEGAVMSEVTAPNFDEHNEARELIRKIAGDCWNGRGDMLDRVHEAIRRAYPKSAKWTRRRVRAMWHREQAVTGWREMRELETVAVIERRKRKLIEEARRDHDDFLARIGATLDHLVVGDQEFHRENIEALRQMAGGSAHRPVGNAAGECDIDPALGGSHIRKIDE